MRKYNVHSTTNKNVVVMATTYNSIDNIWNNGMENGFALYEGKRGLKHIFQLDGYIVIEKYAK